MKKRSPVAVLLLPFVTFGIYSIYWLVKTKGEMKALGADIPTAWLIIVPLVNFWWYWKYCKGVEQVTNGKLNGALAFIGFLVIGFIMSAIVQDSFNNVGSGVSAASAAPELVSVAAPATEPGVPVSTAPVQTTAPTTDTTTPTQPPTPPSTPLVQ
ncbi:DUF4234 domain-containing protein [bacterium]|nr:DUF4234 domain-containing protein [bacterium]NDC94583.1 DUF4234 domain-containing protein [bacterium]NDD84163.1 DUF4234 domain-containing protein [bacterium]NDG29956.1 DUF4234 domain-containing protein [bacterium]